MKKLRRDEKVYPVGHLILRFLDDFPEGLGDRRA